MEKDITHNEYLLLKRLESGESNNCKKDTDLEIDMCWELVRSGYLKNIILTNGA